MTMIQSKDHREKSYEINIISLLCFNDNYTLKTINMIDYILVSRINYSEQLFCQTIKYYFNLTLVRTAFLSS